MSRPKKMIMTKKQTDHSWGSGIMAIAWGYVINARPGPEKESVDLTQKAFIQFLTQKQNFTNSRCHRFTTMQKTNLCINILLKACPLRATTPECCCTLSWYDHLPDSATSAMGMPCLWAMNPNTEKTANPAAILVPLFSKQSHRLLLENTTTALCTTGPGWNYFNWIPLDSWTVLLTWVVSLNLIGNTCL